MMFSNICINHSFLNSQDNEILQATSCNTDEESLHCDVLETKNIETQVNIILQNLYSI